MPAYVLRDRRSGRDEGVHRCLRVRIADRERADDEPVRTQAQALAEYVRVAGHTRLRAAAEAGRHQAEHHVLQEEPELQERTGATPRRQVAHQRDRRTVEAQVAPQVGPARRLVVAGDTECREHAGAGRARPLLGHGIGPWWAVAVLEPGRRAAVELPAQPRDEPVEGRSGDDLDPPWLPVARRGRVRRRGQHPVQDLPRYGTAGERARAVPRRGETHELVNGDGHELSKCQYID